MNILTELLGEKHFCVRPGVFEAYRSSILHNIDTHTIAGVEKENHLQAFAVMQNGDLTLCPQSLQDFKTAEEIAKDDVLQTYLVDPSHENGYPRDDENTDLVNIMRLTGPMSRSGDGCTYGSMDLRDFMMHYANNARVKAHIIYCHTPGGMASTIRDFRKAVNYCHSKGQKVYMFCDGDVASGGAFLACLCDEVWANNPEDQIGSLGMYCAFFTLGDGAENKITSEVYHEMYADASTDKNGWYRKAAEGDMSQLHEELNQDLAQMLADAKKDRPSVKAEQMTGKMYKMRDVKGSLIDRFGSLSELCQYAISENKQRNGKALPPKDQAPAPIKNTNTNSNHQNQMKTYSNIAAMIGEEAFESQTDGYVSLNAEQADALEKRAGEVALMQTGFNAMSQDLANARAMVEQLTKSLEETKAALEAAKQTDDQTALEQTNQELADTKEALQAANETIAAKDAELQTAHDDFEAKEQELATAKESLTAKETELATANQTIEDLKQTLESVNAAPGAQPNAGEAPKTNGSEVSAPKMVVNAFSWNPALSTSENLRLKREHDQKLKALALSSH